MTILHPRKPRKVHWEDFVVRCILNTNKEEVENFFIRYFIKIRCMFYIEKKIIYCNDFDTSFSTFVSTLFIVQSFFFFSISWPSYMVKYTYRASQIIFDYLQSITSKYAHNPRKIYPFLQKKILLAILNFSKWFILFKFSDLSPKS